MYKKFNLFFILLIIICMSFVGSAEQEIYKPIITNDNILSATVFSTGNINTMNVKFIDGRLHVSDSVHGVKNLCVLKSMLVNRLKGYNGKEVMLYHVNDAGVKDSSRLVPIQSDETWTYFYDVGFSEVIIDGFVGTCEVTAYNLSVSDSLGFGQTFNTSNVTLLSVNVTDDAIKSHPYDINYTGCILEWRADGDFNDTQGVNTLTGYNVTFDDGKYDEAGVFNPSNFSYADCGSDTSLNATSAITIEAFIKLNNEHDGTQDREEILYKSDAYSFNLVGSQLNGQLLIQVWQSAAPRNIYSIKTSWDADVWYYVVGTFDGTTGKIYINGIDDTAVDDTLNQAIDTSIDTLYIGSTHIQDFQNYVNGTMDSIRVWNRLLLVEEIQHNYYDHLQQLQIKTNSNSTWSSEWNSTADNPIQVPYGADELFNLLNFTVPDTVIQYHNGEPITIYDYPSTVQFDAIITVGYTEDITKITETATAGTYTLNVTHAAGNTGEGYINYTTANTVLLDANFWNAAVLTTDNPNASLSTTLPYFKISTGYVAAGTEYYYLVTLDYFYPPINIQTTSSQYCVNITWGTVPNADNYSVYELEDGFPYVNTNPIVDGVKDAIYNYAHEFLIFSPNPITHGDYGTIYPARTALGAYLLIESIDNDDKLGDDDTIYYFDLDNDGLTVNDPAWKITNNIVKKYLWNGNNWAVTGSTNAVGDSTGGGTHYPIHELFIPVAELGSNWTNGSIVKVLVKREDSALNPDVVTWYPYGNINNTDTGLWQEMVLNDPDSYIFLNNTINLWYNVTGLTPFTIYHGAVTAWNGTQETDYSLFDAITDDIQYFNVSGYIFDVDNNLLSNAIVYSCNGFVHEITTTNESGYYIGYNFREGNYTICANKSGYIQNSIDIYVSTNLTNQNITLSYVSNADLFNKMLKLESQNDEILLNMSVNNTIINDKIDTILIFILLNMAVIVGIIIGKRGKDNDK